MPAPSSATARTTRRPRTFQRFRSHDGHPRTFGAPGELWVKVIGGVPRLAIPFGIVIGVFVIGLYVFNREAPRIAENL